MTCECGLCQYLTYVVAQVRIDDDDKVAGRVFHAVYVSSAQTQFRRPRLQHNLLLAVDLLQVLGHVQRSIRTAIVDHDYLVVEITGTEEEGWIKNKSVSEYC